MNTNLGSMRLTWISTVRCSLLVLMSCVVPQACNAEVQLPALWSNHMILQRDMPIHCWGLASPGERVRVQMRTSSAESVADDLGQWSLYLPAVSAGGPFEIVVHGENEIKIDDVMVGDVWVASGQSNMEFPMKDVANAATEIAKADQYDIRILKVDHAYSEFPLRDLKSPALWAKANSNNVADFSAVAYLFARAIQEREHIPVGVIETAWGGTPAEAWTSLDALTSSPDLFPVFKAWSQMLEQQQFVELQIAQEKRKYDASIAAGQKPQSLPGHRDINMWHPSYLFNAMVAPLTLYPIKGVIWYQGEANTPEMNAPYYGPLFRAMIEDWRIQWKEGDFPFLFVQIANIKAASPTSKWAEIRDAQLQALVLHHTGMAVTADIGEANNIHPKNKQDVAYRLSLQARRLAYGENIEASGPLYERSITVDHQLKIWFEHANGLSLRGDGATAFEVAGEDGIFHPAVAKVEGGVLVISSADVLRPVRARYAWADNPQCVLYNAEELPASPFITR